MFDFTRMGARWILLGVWALLLGACSSSPSKLEPAALPSVTGRSVLDSASVPGLCCPPDERSSHAGPSFGHLSDLPFARSQMAMLLAVGTMILLPGFV
jgi:hypothetical protein